MCIRDSGSTGGPGGSGTNIPSPLGGGQVCGGGGGGNYNNGPAGSGSFGGKPGSNGGGGNPAPTYHDGTANTGGGGGGCNESGPGSAGGSGVVIISHPSSLVASNPGGGLTWSSSPTYTRITSGSGNIRFV